MDVIEPASYDGLEECSVALIVITVLFTTSLLGAVAVNRLLQRF